MPGARPFVDVAWVVVPPGARRREHAWALLAGMLPRDAELENACPRCGGLHGPVTVANAPFVASVTYAGGYAIAAVAAATDASALGIDAEPVADARRDAAGLAGVLGPGEATVRDWTRVEAALKADGRGLRVDPAEVRVSAHGDADGWTATLPDGGAFTGWDAPGPPGTVLSVAVRLPR